MVSATATIPRYKAARVPCGSLGPWVSRYLKLKAIKGPLPRVLAHPWEWTLVWALEITKTRSLIPQKYSTNSIRRVPLSAGC